MQPRWLPEWFALGAFASWVVGSLIEGLVRPPTGRWASEDMVRLTPLLGFFLALVAAAPLYLRTLWARHRRFHYRFYVPLALGLLLAPLVVGTMSLAESVCQSSVIDVVALMVILAWPIVLGEIAYRACRIR